MCKYTYKMSENCEIGLKYYNEKQYEKALEYFQLAADNGNAVAQDKLGIMYHKGYGVEKSYQKAVEYYQLSADNGYSNAQINLDNLKSSKEYIQYELLEQRKIHELLKQQIEFLETQIKYRPGGSGYKEVKEHFESLT
jgi:TPR repeat protein